MPQVLDPGPQIKTTLQKLGLPISTIEELLEEHQKEFLVEAQTLGDILEVLE